MKMRRILVPGAAIALLLVGTLPVSAHSVTVSKVNSYAVTVLQTNTSDPDLVNGWGLSRGPATPWWVSDNGTDKSTLYNGIGTKLGLVVTIPGGAPTGTVFNGNPASFNGDPFLFDSEAGIISAWRGALGTAAEVGTDQSARHAVYKGLAIGTLKGKDYLYATDFHNNRIDVFNSTFVLQQWAGAFKDPKLPHHYAPFGIQNLNGRIFVTYAKQQAGSDDEKAGQGLGIVDMYRVDGKFLARVGTFGVLNAPWGLAMAPTHFGRFNGDLIVGNFGDGRLHAFHWDGHHWHLAGTLLKANHNSVRIKGLWAIAFGGGTANNGSLNALYYAAGPNDEAGGAFGTITFAR
jgi:uncharacterized protein (TIGR03118 family)